MIREGLTSVARMLPDTSITSITVATRDGRLTSAEGRAIASSRKVKASNISAGGICRRQPEPGPACLIRARLG